MQRNLVMTQAKKIKSEGRRDKEQGTHISCLGGIWVKHKSRILKWNREKPRLQSLGGLRTFYFILFFLKFKCILECTKLFACL